MQLIWTGIARVGDKASNAYRSVTHLSVMIFQAAGSIKGIVYGAPWDHVEARNNSSNHYGLAQIA